MRVEDLGMRRGSYNGGGAGNRENSYSLNFDEERSDIMHHHQITNNNIISSVDNLDQQQ